eukprot:6456783-Amphidinium_carterae.1
MDDLKRFSDPRQASRLRHSLALRRVCANQHGSGRLSLQLAKPRPIARNCVLNTHLLQCLAQLV